MQSSQKANSINFYRLTLAARIEQGILDVMPQFVLISNWPQIYFKHIVSNARPPIRSKKPYSTKKLHYILKCASRTDRQTK